MTDFDVPEKISEKEALVRAVEADVLDSAPWCVLADYLLEINEGRGYEVITTIILPRLVEIYREAATYKCPPRILCGPTDTTTHWIKLVLIDVRKGEFRSCYHLRDNE